MNTMEKLWNELKIGLQDFMDNTGFKNVIIGVSGGLDSAIVAVLAAEVLGGKNVLGLAMPSKYSSPVSEIDAKTLIRNINGNFRSVPINNFFNSFQNVFNFTGIAEENLQARIRGLILMEVSNQEGGIVLCPTNKSEAALGYSTLYGDTVGSYAPIGDVKKTILYELAKWINRENEIIPENTINRLPSAELALDQTDQDTLPPYEIIDDVIGTIVENGGGLDLLVKEYGPIVFEIEEKIKRNAWKRAQEPVGVKVSKKTFTEYDRELQDKTG